MSSLRTAHVSLTTNGKFSLFAEGNRATSGRFHALCCETTDAEAISTFLALINALLDSREKIDAEALERFFHTLVTLFSTRPALDLASARQGLWGELFFMQTVRGFKYWLPYWHEDPSRRFDFSVDGCRVEVKTTIHSQRIHHFSHRQVFPEGAERILIASLLLQEDDTGVSLALLIDACLEKVEVSQRMKFERAVRRAGMDGTDDVGPRFDGSHAESNLRWFDSVDVPHFALPEPAGVSETRYRVDLSTAPPVAERALKNWLDEWTNASATSEG